MKQTFSLTGGIASGALLMALATTLAMQNIPQNMATWVMWTVVDGLILWSSISAGNRRPWLALGYTLGAASVTTVLFLKGTWHWGDVETLAAAGAIIGIICWKTLGARSAIVALSIAMTAAGIPALHDAWVLPNPASWWFWSGMALACILTILGAKAWRVEEVFLPCISFLYNIAMFAVILR